MGFIKWILGYLSICLLECGVVWFFSKAGFDYNIVLLACSFFFVVVIFTYYTQTDFTTKNRVRNNMNLMSKYDYEKVFPKNSKVEAENDDKRIRLNLLSHAPALLLIVVIITNIAASYIVTTK